MSLATAQSDQIIDTLAADAAQLQAIVDQLRSVMEAAWSIWDAAGNQLVPAAADQPPGDASLLGGVLQAVVHRNQPEVVAEADHVLWLALPLQPFGCDLQVAAAPFAIGRPASTGPIAADARLLGVDEPRARQWLESQRVWDPDVLLQLAQTLLAKAAAERRAEQLEWEIENLSANLSSTYEEISLLYTVTQNLRLTRTDEELGQQVLDWLMECVPAVGMAIQFLPVAEEGETSYVARTQPTLITSGQCPIDNSTMTVLVEAATRRAGRWPLVANHRVTQSAQWPFPQIRQLILTPLCEGDNIHGWMAALNHVDGGEFDSIHANLLVSIAAILGIHSGNHELYRQQAEFMADVVRALTSAIDAKDPYTCGHSDRVARISVRLARELGCSDEMLNTIYMAGLLHDIGKIGISDSVLGKTGRLSDAEYEHIKIHPQLGYKILADLKQFSDVVPVVLHHHEQWDGRGYPHALRATGIPYLARICAVADAYDAMTSDRPYRKGMPVEKVDRIFREGRGTQWDPAVIDAYFAAKDDIRRIAQRERETLRFDVQQWD